MTRISTACRMMHYMAWANRVTLDNAAQLSDAILHQKQDTLFGSIAGTFDHILVVEEMFMAHLCGKKHEHKARSRATGLTFAECATRLTDLDQRFITLAAGYDEKELQQIVHFDYVDGGSGAMRREDIFLHLANHSTYHRGFISVLMYPHKVQSAASDFTVFLRDIWPEIVGNDLGLTKQ